MEVSGIIKKMFPEQTFSSGFKKKEVVVTTQEQYPQDILVEFLQDKIAILSNFSEGDEVKISINLRGREWINPEGVAKYFNSITGWRIEKNAPESVGGNDSPPVENYQPQDFTKDDSDVDDLPF